MKRNQGQPVKPYIPKRLRKQQNERNSSNESTNSVETNNQRITKQPIVVQVNASQDGSQAKPALIKAHAKAVTSLKWNPVFTNNIVSSSLDKEIFLWKYSQGRLLREHVVSVHSEGVKDVRWSVDGLSLLSASFDKTCQIIDGVSGVSKEKITFDDMATSSIFHPTDPNVILSGTFSNGIHAWDIRQNKLVRKYSSFFGQIQDVMFLPDNQTFLSSAEVLKRNSLDKTIMAWDYTTGAVLSTQIYPEPFSCTCLKIHPNKSNFLAQSSAGYIAIFDAEKPWRMNRRKRFEGQQTGGYHVDLDVSCNGHRVYSGDITGCFFIFDWYTSKVRKKLKIFDSPCVALASHPFNGNRVGMGSWDM